MRAHASHTFDNAFAVDEERLRKIANLMLSRGRAINPTAKVLYDVARSDLLEYQTDDIDAVLAEENAPWNALTNLTLQLAIGEELKAEIVFDRAVTLSVEGDNRDNVFLLFSDIRQYIGADVANLKPLPFSSLVSWPIFMVVTSIVFIGWMLFSTLQSDRTASYNDQQLAAQRQAYDDQAVRQNQAIASALASGSLDDKVNTLLQMANQSPQDFPLADYPSFAMVMWVGLAALGGAFILMRGLLLWWRSAETGVFLIGREKRKEEHRAKTRERLIWGVLVALLIGITSSIIAAIILSRG